MIDGIQLTYSTPNPKTHLLGLPCWNVMVEANSGQIVDEVRTAKLLGLYLKLIPSISGGYRLFTNGSLHKFHNGGEHNANQFTFKKLVESIDSLTNKFGLTANQCYIHGLEIGLNIPLPHSLLSVLKNLVCYRSRPFTQINKRSARMGMLCALTQYSVKMYDKAKQSGIACGNILRLEVSVNKMQVLNEYQIKTLADLQVPERVYPLVNVLLEALDNIIWTDYSVNIKLLSDKEQKKWLYYSNPQIWQYMNKYKRNRALKEWRTLLHKYGNPPNLHPLVVNAWESLFLEQTEAEKPQPFYQPLLKDEAAKNATFLLFNCNVKRLQPLPLQTTITNASFQLLKTTYTSIKKTQPLHLNSTCCLVCGKDISHQRKGSLFCSEKKNSINARKCRNKDSNRRRGKKTKIHRAIMQNNYLVITYTDGKGNTYTDTLHPSEVTITKEWLDRIISISALPKTKETLAPISNSEDKQAFHTAT